MSALNLLVLPHPAREKENPQSAYRSQHKSCPPPTATPTKPVSARPTIPSPNLLTWLTLSSQLALLLAAVLTLPKGSDSA